MAVGVLEAVAVEVGVFVSVAGGGGVKVTVYEGEGMNVGLAVADGEGVTVGIARIVHSLIAVFDPPFHSARAVMVTVVVWKTAGAVKSTLYSLLVGVIMP